MRRLLRIELQKSGHGAHLERDGSNQPARLQLLSCMEYGFVLVCYCFGSDGMGNGHEETDSGTDVLNCFVEVLQSIWKLDFSHYLSRY